MASIVRSVGERNQLVEEHLHLASWAVARFCPGARRDLKEDLIQAARVGLIRAAAQWDPSRGEFATYAVGYLLEELGGLLRDEDLIRIPRNIRGQDLRAVRQLSRVEPDGLGLVADERPGPVEEVLEREASERLEAAKASLPQRLRSILGLRLQGETQRGVGAVLGMSKRWVRQLDAEILSRLTAALSA